MPELLSELQCSRDMTIGDYVQFICGPEDGRGCYHHIDDMDRYIGSIGGITADWTGGDGFRVVFTGGGSYYIPKFRLKRVDISKISAEEIIQQLRSAPVLADYFSSVTPGFVPEVAQRYVSLSYTYLCQKYGADVEGLFSNMLSDTCGLSNYAGSNLHKVIKRINSVYPARERAKRFIYLSNFLLKTNFYTLGLFFSCSCSDLESIAFSFSFLSPKKRPVYMNLYTCGLLSPGFIKEFREHADVQFMPKGTNLRPVNGSRVPQRTCSKCNRVTEKRYVARAGIGYVCFECSMRYRLKTCGHPGCTNITSHSDSGYCEKHKHLYVFCEVLRENILRRDSITVGVHAYMSQSVAYRRGNCNVCGSSEVYRYMSYEHGNGWKCTRCRSPQYRQLHSYSYKPEPVFFDVSEKKSSTSNLFFGLELELETSPRKRLEYAAGVFHSKAGKDFAYCKTDGSIQHGIEIVTHPASFGYWNVEEAFFNGIEELVNEVGATAKTNTGIHVHVSRKAFASDEHIRRFALFFTALHSRYPKTAGTILGRGPNSYCSLIPTRAGKPQYLKTIPNYCEKYRQVNTGLQHTVEVRSFASSTIKGDILRCIEVAHAVFMFTKHEVSLPILASPKKKFLTWFTTFVRRMGYKNLIACFNANSIK